MATALLCLQCGRYFIPDRNISDRLDDADVMGEWVVTPETLRLAQREGFSPEANERYSIRFEARRDGAMMFAA